MLQPKNSPCKNFGTLNSPTYVRRSYFGVGFAGLGLSGAG